MNKKLVIMITVLGMIFAGSAMAMNNKKPENPQNPSNGSPGNSGNSPECPGAPRADRMRIPLDYNDPRVQAVRKRLFEDEEEGEQE